MGVGRPKDFVTIRNRFPAQNQRLPTSPNERFVTISDRNLVIMRGLDPQRLTSLGQTIGLIFNYIVQV